MQEHRRQILTMLAEGKITADQAERLLTAMDAGDAAAQPASSTAQANGNGSHDAGAKTAKIKAKYLRVLVEANEGTKGLTTVNVRIPMQLLYAGVRLASLIPVQAHQHLDEALSKKGIPLTLSQIKPENLEELIDHLEDLTVDIDAREAKAKVKVFCE
jgi:hypothetical protein